MVTEDYCSYEVSKLLKEKGFNIPTHTFYDPSKSHYIVKFDPCLIDRNAGTCVSAPTHQMALKWLREVHNILIVVEPHTYDYVNDKNSSYVISLWQGDNYCELITSKDYPTYEEAVDTAIKYCLTNLI